MLKFRKKSNPYKIVAKPPIKSWHTPAKYISDIRFEVGDRVGVRLLANKYDKRKHTCKAIQYSVGQITKVIPSGCQPYRKIYTKYDFYKVARKARRHTPKTFKAHPAISRSTALLYVVSFPDSNPVICPAHKLRHVIIDRRRMLESHYETVDMSKKEDAVVGHLMRWIMTCTGNGLKIKDADV